MKIGPSWGSIFQYCGMVCEQWWFWGVKAFIVGGGSGRGDGEWVGK